jgi:sodium/bile acid cotransporter 7
MGMLVAVTMAKVFPSLGKNGGILRPEVFIGNYGVAIIFLLSGFSLQTSDLAKAISNFKLNGLVNLLLFGFWPYCIGIPLRHIFTVVLPNLIPSGLADGLLVMTTLPTTVNMCIMLTSASGGNAASAICNAVISNLAGILLTPLLLLKFFGASIKLPFGKMVLKLCQKVLLPVTIGQLLRTSDGAKSFYKTHSKKFKRLQETVLLGIVWNAFCNAFSDGLGIQLKHSLVLLALLPTLHLMALAASFKFFSLSYFGFTREETIAAMFCSSQKTLAFGLPLINTIFQGNPNLALFCAPLMFIHPLQMTIGSFLLPTIQKYIEQESTDAKNAA